MIPRIQTGSSFKGAGLYYLHDKKLEGETERYSAARVAWTHSLNTLEDDPQAVIREMQHTAMCQQMLKQQSGKRTDGRPTEQTVMTVALAWSPEQSPDRQQMIAAGESFLKHMGWQDHQILFIAHNDTKHPHVHLLINRVHPETGMTMDANWSKIRSQKWALAYEREHGQIYCHAREAKYDRDQTRDARHMSYREWRLWQEIAKDGTIEPEFRKAMEAGEWDVLKGSQRDSRIGFWKETATLSHELRGALREDVRAEFAPKWREYALEKERLQEKAQLYDREARRAIRQLRSAGGTRQSTVERVQGPDGRVYRKRRGIESKGIEQIKERQKAFHARQRGELWEMRSAIASGQKERLEELTAPALDKLRADRAATYAEELKGQRDARAELRHDQKGGERRRDVLSGYGDKTPVRLTPEQATAYILHAREVAGRQQAFEHTRKEVSQAREPAAQQNKPAQVATDRSREKRDKDQRNEAKRQAGLEWYLQKREKDRDRERGGGRDR